MSEHVSTPTSRHREASNIVMVRRYERPKMGLLVYESPGSTYKPGKLELKWMHEANNGATTLTFEQWVRKRRSLG